MKYIDWLFVATFLCTLSSGVFAYELRMQSESTGGEQRQFNRIGFACDDGFLDNAYFQTQNVAYGNSFDVGPGGVLSSVEFWHHGYQTLAGPYQYLVRVYDDVTCAEIATIGPLEAADAFDHDELEIENLCDFGLAVSGEVAVTIEALSCAAPSNCFPDLYIDQTGTRDFCDRIIDTNAPACNPIGNGDFTLRITVDECPVPVETVTWSQLKNVYR